MKDGVDETWDRNGGESGQNAYEVEGGEHDSE